MENFSYHIPFYVVTGGIKAEGHSSELAPGQVGLYDRATWSVATASGSGKEFFFAQGSGGGLTWDLQPISETHKSPFFYGKDVENMYVSLPKRLQNEEWVLGFNGATSSKGLTYEVGKAVRVKFLFKGQAAYRFFGGPKEYLVSYTPPKDCTAPCTEDDCPEPIGDCLVHTQAIINLINEHVELRKFGVQAKLVNAPFTAATTNMTKYCMSVCDNGDTVALNAVKAQYPTVNITRTNRAGSTSTYEFCQSDDASAPANFAQTGSVLQAVCGTCPSGSTTVAAKDVYTIKRVVAAGTDLTTDNTKDTFADTVGTAYGVTTDADKTFLGLDGAVAIIKVKAAKGATVAPIGSDIVEFTHTEEAQCTFAAPASVAWASCGTGISSSRVLRINQLKRLDCGGADRLADLTSILAGVEGIQIGTLTKIAGVGCADDYTVAQDSVDCLDESCLTNNVTFTYDTLPAYEGSAWEVVPPTVTENTSRKCGIRVSAGYFDPKNDNCTFDITSYYEVDPVRFEISLFDESEGVCDVKNWPSVLQTKIGQSSRQSGEEIIREVIYKDASYLGHLVPYVNDPLMNAKNNNDIVSRIDRNAFYKIYYVTYGASYGKSYRKNEQEKFTTKFAFKETDPAAADFEAKIISVLEGKAVDAQPFHIIE